MTKSTPFSIGLAVCGLVSALTSGCQQQVHCPVLKDCGGPVPVGTWTLTPQVVDAAGNVIAPIHGSCIEDLYVPVSDPRLVGGGDVPAARTPPPEPALYDWCDGLLTSSGTKIDNRDAVFYTERAGWCRLDSPRRYRRLVLRHHANRNLLARFSCSLHAGVRCHGRQIPRMRRP